MSWTDNLHLKKHPQEHWETLLNQELVQLIESVGTRAYVKSEPKSLPYQGEIVFEKIGSSYANASWAARKSFYRDIIKQILAWDCYKIRFYCEVSRHEKNIEGISPLGNAIVNGFGGIIKYTFKYYKH